jgi:hypothetical protein
MSYIRLETVDSQDHPPLAHEVRNEMEEELIPVR